MPHRSEESIFFEHTNPKTNMELSVKMTGSPMPTVAHKIRQFRSDAIVQNGRTALSSFLFLAVLMMTLPGIAQGGCGEPENVVSFSATPRFSTTAQLNT